MVSLKLHKRNELKRYTKIFSVLAKYGFEDIMSNSQIRKIIPNKYYKKYPDTEKLLSFSKFERIRMVLEDLGPTYVKLGQIFSSREDILPSELIKQLEKLQDEVPLIENFDVEEVIEEELNINIVDYFQFIDSKPLAAASLAQVHKAELLNGEVVILKIQRPNIKETIETDILVMKEIAQGLEKYSKQVKAFQPIQIVLSFEKSIYEELQFLREIDNVERFAKNFKEDESIYVPRVYRELSNDHIICMEYINGIKVSEIEELTALNVNVKDVAKVGVNLYLKQVLEYGFFHADPHPGNIFVLPEKGQLCFIDFGMIGNIMPNDKELLEDLLIHFMQKNTKKIVSDIKKIAVKSSIPDQKKFEYDIYELLQNISNIDIQHIRLDTLFEQFKNIIYHNKITLPHYLYMLMRALVLIEGIGLKLDPEFNITNNLEPYIRTISVRRYSPKRFIKNNFKKFQNITNLLTTLPDDIQSILEKVKEGELVIIHEHKGAKELENTLNRASTRLVYSIIIAALSIGSALLVMSDMPPKIYNIPILGAVGFVISAILGFMIVISIFKNKQF